MPVRKAEEKNIRKLIRTSGGKSFGVTIPIEIIRKLKWHERQKLVVKYLGGGKIQIRDWKMR